MFRHVSAIHSTPVYLLESWARPHCQPMRSASLGENPPGPNSFHPKNTGKSNISSPRWWKFLIHPPQLSSQQSSITGQPTYYPPQKKIQKLHSTSLLCAPKLGGVSGYPILNQVTWSCKATVPLAHRRNRGVNTMSPIHGMGFCMLMVSRRGLDVYIWAPKWLEISGWGVDSMNILVSPRLLKSNSWSATLRSFWCNLVFG